MDELQEYTKQVLGISLTKTQRKAFQVYEQELIQWNAKYNLTAIDAPEKIKTKHFLDSLTCLSVINDEKSLSIIDVGTGAGFPGLPLKIINPEWKMTLVDSVGKKTKFCEHIASKLNLTKIEIIQERAEKLGKQPQHREQYDWAVSRAVARLPILAEYLLPLVKVGGKVLAMKGETAHAEAQNAEYAIRLLGGHLSKLIPFTLPGVVEEHYLVIIDKIAATPEKYPRRTGIPAKRPLVKNTLAT